MSGALAGVRVIDAATMLAGPLSAQILGDHGADVIKIEHPTRADPVRNHPPRVGEHSLWWKQVSRNKRSIAIDFSKEEGADLLLALVAQSDVLVENFRTGTLDKWGLGWDRLKKSNPNLIVLRVTGYGQTGPYARRAGFGTIAEAMSGFAAMTGQPDEPPLLPPFGLADAIAGVTGAAAVAMALYHRAAHGGVGQEIDLSLLAPMTAAMGVGPAMFQKLGELQPRLGNGVYGTSPRNVYRTKDDKWVAVSAAPQSVAERVVRLVGHEELIEQPWFDTNLGRYEHSVELDAYVGDWIRDRTRDDAIERFSEAGASIGPIYTADELLEDPHVMETGMLATFDDPDVGEVVQNAPTFLMSATPGSIRFLGTAFASASDEVFQGELGLSAERLQALRASGVVA